MQVTKCNKCHTKIYYEERSPSQWLNGYASCTCGGIYSYLIQGKNK